MRNKFIKHLSRNKIAYVIGAVLVVVGIVSAAQSVPNFDALDNEAATGNVAKATNQVTFTSKIPSAVYKGDAYEVSWASNVKKASLYLVSEKTGKPILLAKTTGNSITFTLPATVTDGIYYYGVKAGGLAKSTAFTVSNKVTGAQESPNTSTTAGGGQSFPNTSTAETSSAPSTSTGTMEPKTETSLPPSTGIPTTSTTPSPTSQPVTGVLKVGVNVKNAGFTISDSGSLLVAKNSGSDCQLSGVYFTCQYINLKKGVYMIDFQDVEGFNTPFDQTIEFDGISAEVYGKYIR